MITGPDTATEAPAGRVLVVDDNDLNRELLDQELSDLGFEVLAVGSGAEALEQVPRFGPDAIVLDIQMPGMDGFEVLERLRATWGQTELPVVMATALTGTDDIVTAFDKGANDYVTKPIDIAVLVARLRTVLRVRRAKKQAGGFASLEPAPAPAASAAPERHCSHCLSVRAEDDPFCTSCGASRQATGWPPIDRERTPWLGRTVGERYLLDRYLDGGGRGQVYRAVGLDLGREFAAKLVDFQSPDPERLARLRDELVNEIQAMVHLRNPHVVQIYEVVQVSDTLYALIMEWVPGLPLDRWVRATGPMPPHDALAVVRQAALGLYELHRHGLVHRDVKPANLVVEQLQGGGLFAKLLDFGIASRARELGEPGRFVGTVHFAAPEQATPEQGVDKRADMYGLGCTLWFLLTGRAPFSGSKPLTVLYRHAHEPLPSVLDGRETMPPLLAACDALLRDMTRKDPDERVRDMPALLERIDRLLADGVPSLSVASGPVLELRHRLGRGGYGDVFRGRLHREGGVALDVAIKLLHPNVALDPSATARLRDEARLLAALNHPAILKVHDLTTHDGRAALVTEFVDGQDLADLIRGPTRIPRRALYEALELVAGALDAAYTTTGPAGGELRLVHRDVKPRNIRIGRHGDVKLLDFGISRAENVELEHDTGHGVLGTRMYMAPERFEGTVGPAGDVFSLGCVLYEALCGERLLERIMPDQLLVARYQRDDWEQVLRARLDLLPADLEPEARSLVRAMIELDASQRPTAGEVARRLASLSEQANAPGLRGWCREVDLRSGDPEERTRSASSRAETTIVDALTPRASVETLAPQPMEPAKRPAWLFAGLLALAVILGLATVLLLS